MVVTPADGRNRIDSIAVDKEGPPPASKPMTAIVTPSARPAKGPRTALANSPIEECWAILAGAQPVTSVTCLTKFVLVRCTSESNDFSFPAWIAITAARPKAWELTAVAKRDGCRYGAPGQFEALMVAI